jgi:phage terminase large subunit GpA-like protein
MQLDDYDGAAAIAAAWADGLRPDPSLTVSAWADRHRVLSPRGANEAGPWRTSRTPYLKEIMDHLSPSHPCQRVVFMKGAQTGGSRQATTFWATSSTTPRARSWRCSRRWSWPSGSASSGSSPDRGEPDAAGTRRPGALRDSGNTVLAKTFPGGILVLTGANSAVGLRSMPARYLFLDEVDAYPPSADEEGDPVALAEARTRTFAWRRKVFLVSTPTIRGSSRIEREYEASDQRRFFVGCPHCGHRQWLSLRAAALGEGPAGDRGLPLRGLRRADRGAAQDGDARRGEWRATATSADPLTVGFHISSLYSPLGWLSWERIARDWLAAQGSDEAIRSFKNGVLGETWMESGEAPDWQRCSACARAGPPARCRPVPSSSPPGPMCRRTGSRSMSGPGAGAGELAGRSPGDRGRARQCPELGGARCAAGPDLGARVGGALPLMRLAIDTGYEAPAVYAWARRAGFAQVAPVKGVEGFNRASPVTARPSSTPPTAASGSRGAGSGPWRSRPSRPRPTASSGSTGRARSRAPRQADHPAAGSTCRAGSTASGSSSWWPSSW